MELIDYKIKGASSKNLLLVSFLFFLYFIARTLMVGENNEIYFMVFNILLFIVPIIIFGVIQNKVVNLAIFYSLLYIFQNIMIGIGLNFTNTFDSKQIQIVIMETSLFGFIIFFFLLVQNNKTKIFAHKYEVYGLLLLIFTAFYFFVGHSNLMSSLAYGRNIFLIVISTIIGKIIISNEVDFRIFLKYIFSIGLIVAFFGLIERVFFTPEIWYEIFNLDKVLIAKGMGSKGTQSFPSLWYTSILNITVRRMASFFMEPVNMAYFFVVPLILSFVLRKKFLFLVFLIALILCFGKGGFLVSFISMTSILLLAKFKKNNGFAFLFLYLILSTLILSYLYFKISPGTALPHLWGLMSIEDNLIHNPFGHGLGSGGNFDSIFNSIDLYTTLQTGSESGVSTLVYKLGVVGLFLYTMFFILLGNELVRINLEHKTEDLGKIALGSAGLILGLLFGSIFQENPLGPQTNHMILLLAGTVIGASKLKRIQHN